MLPNTTIHRFTNATVITPNNSWRSWNGSTNRARVNGELVDLPTSGREPVIFNTTDEVTVTVEERREVESDTFRLKVSTWFPEEIDRETYQKLSKAVADNYVNVPDVEVTYTDAGSTIVDIPRPLLTAEEYAQDIETARDLFGDRFEENANDHITGQTTRSISYNDVLRYLTDRINQDDMSISGVLQHRYSSFSRGDCLYLLIRYHAEPWRVRSKSVLQKTKAGRPYADRRTRLVSVGPEIMDTLMVYGDAENLEERHIDDIHRHSSINIAPILADNSLSYRGLFDTIEELFHKVTFDTRKV